MNRILDPIGDFTEFCLGVFSLISPNMPRSMSLKDAAVETMDPLMSWDRRIICGSDQAPVPKLAAEPGTGCKSSTSCFSRQRLTRRHNSGGLGSAARHTELAEDLLKRSPNVWMAALAENTRGAIALMRSEYVLACSHVRKALALAEESGAAIARRASLANLGIATYVLR